MGQTKAVRCEQRNVREFAELHDLDAPFLKQIGLQVMQACPHIQHGVAFVGEVQGHVEGKAWIAFSYGHHGGL